MPNPPIPIDPPGRGSGKGGSGGGVIPQPPLPTLPDWYPPDDSGRPPAEILNNLKRPPTKTFAAANSVIPICWGRDKIVGKPFVIRVKESLGYLYVAYGFCQGEIEDYELVYIDGLEVSTPTDGFLAQSGAQMQERFGTSSQGISSLLQEAIDGYSDTCTDTAYIVLRVPKGATRGFPQCEAIIKGRKVYDPRLDSTNGGSGAHRLNDATTWEWSENPTLCFADFIVNFTSWDINWPSVILNANYNDELVGGVARRTIGLTMYGARTVTEWVQAFRVYMGAFIAWEDGVVRVVPDRKDVDFPGGILFNRGKSSGSYDNVTAAHNAALDFGTGDFTIEAMINPDSIAEDGTIIAKYQDGASARWQMIVTSDHRLKLNISDGTNAANVTSPADVIVDDVWQRVSIVGDQTANTATFYVNGVAVGSPQSFASVTGSLSNTSANIRMGGLADNSNPFVGVIDDVRVWKTIRSSGQILDNALVELTGAESNLYLYWKNNNFEGTSVVDSSPTGVTGTMNNSPLWVLGNPQLIPLGVAKHFTADDIKDDGLALERRDPREFPNSVVIEYMDSSLPNDWQMVPVQVDSPYVTQGKETRRLSRISLPGFHDASQAYREAVERINWFLSDLTGTLNVFDEGLKLQNGSVIAITHPIGLNAKLFRVTRITGDSGRYTIDFTEYDPAIYSDHVITNPTIPDTDLGNPLKVPTVTGLTAVEELFKYKTGITGSRIRVNWDATSYPFLSQYIVEGYVQGVLVWSTTTLLNEAVSPPVEELVDNKPVPYTIKVYIQSAFKRGPAASIVEQVDGKLLVPGNVENLDVQLIASDKAQLNWTEVVDVDIWKYEIRKGGTFDAWVTATPLDLVDGLSYIATGLEVGTHRFFVKARDSVRKESVNAVYKDVTVSLPEPPPAFEQAFEVSGEVRLRWQPSLSPFVARYKIVYVTSTA